MAEVQTIKPAKPLKSAKLPSAKPVEAVQFGIPTAPSVAVEPAPVEAMPVEATPIEVFPQAAKTAAVTPAIPEPVINEGTTSMNDTNLNTATTTETIANNAASVAHDATAKASAFFGGANDRAKDAMANGTKAIEEFVEFSKGNLEAVMNSGRIAAKGAEEIAKYSAEYGRAAVERANATAKQFAAVKSPTEFFQLQGDVAKQTLDAVVAEGSKFTENYLKLMGEVAQPISSRVAVAVDKVKSTTAA